jgi:hypothetical protein
VSDITHAWVLMATAFALVTISEWIWADSALDEGWRGLLVRAAISLLWPLAFALAGGALLFWFLPYEVAWKNSRWYKKRKQSQ